MYAIYTYINSSYTIMILSLCVRVCGRSGGDISSRYVIHGQFHPGLKLHVYIQHLQQDLPLDGIYSTYIYKIFHWMVLIAHKSTKRSSIGRHLHHIQSSTTRSSIGRYLHHIHQEQDLPMYNIYITYEGHSQSVRTGAVSLHFNAPEGWHIIIDSSGPFLSGA